MVDGVDIIFFLVLIFISGILWDIRKDLKTFIFGKKK